MGYKLNCGIELTECDPYDSFIYEGHPHKLLYLGGKTHFDIEGKRQYMICQDGKEWAISKLTPTEETKRKLAERQGKKEFPGLPVSPPPSLIESLRTLSDSIVADNFGAKSIIQDAINALTAKQLARIVDWRGGESILNGDIVVSYGAISVYRGIGLVNGDSTVIRINTAAIPKQLTMTKAEVEREFGVKVVD